MAAGTYKTVKLLFGGLAILATETMPEPVWQSGLPPSTPELILSMLLPSEHDTPREVLSL